MDKYTRRIIVFVMASICSLSQPGIANEKNETPFSHTTMRQSIQNTSEASQLSVAAKRWGLSLEEWQRYLEIKAGPRGIWSPTIDPIAMLGLEARSDTEMKYYAGLYAKMQDRRISAELKMDRYRREFLRAMYAGVELFDKSLMDKFTKTRVSQKQTLLSRLKAQTAIKSGDRLLLFVDVDSTPIDLIHRISEKVADTPDMHLDIFVLSATSDEAIYAWAGTVGLSSELVSRRQITLNHDGGARKKVTDDTAKTQIFLQRDGQLHRVQETTI